MTWDRIRSSYDRVARKYDEKFSDELAGKPRDRELLAAFASVVGDPVVEVGCGPGQIGVALRAGGRRVVGADLSLPMARLAGARLDGAVVADMRVLPCRTGAIGGVLAFYSLIHVRRHEVASVLREVHRVLRPGGRILLSAHEGRGEIGVPEFLGEPVPFVATLFELPELTTAAVAAGLVVVRTERRAPYPTEGQTVRLYVEAERRR